MTTHDNDIELPPLPEPGEAMSKWAYDESDMQDYARAAIKAALQSQPTNRWYAIDNTGLATLCADKQDAIKTASDAAQLYPQRAPYVVAQMVPADADMQSQKPEHA